MKKIIATSILFLLVFSAKAQEKTERTNILFLLDASYSMRKTWETKSKWTIAKEVVVDVADSLKQSIGDDVYFGIRAYGHQSMPVYSDCKDSELLLSIEKHDISDLKSALGGVSPKGITPLAYSLEETKKDFADLKGKNILILITDGSESCQGDPCYILSLLMKNKVILKPFIIGLDIPIESLQTYECMKGEVFNERSQKNFKSRLHSSLDRAINFSTVQINLLDSKNQATQTDKVMFLYKKKNNELKYTLYHKMNKDDLSDTLFLEPAEYRIEVQSIPKVISKYFKLDVAKHNVLNIKAPTGLLNIIYVNTQGEKVEMVNPLKYLLKKQNEQQYFHQGSFGDRQEVLIGKYDIDLMTMPPVQLIDQEIVDNKETTLKISAPGSINIKSRLPIYGALFIRNVESLINIYSLKPNTTQEILDLQPGEYELVYRFSSEKKMIKTKSVPFTIKSMRTTKINL